MYAIRSYYEPVTPARINRKDARHFRVRQDAFIAEAGLLEQLAYGRRIGRLVVVEGARDRLPEIERRRPFQQQYPEVIRMDDNEYGFRSAEFGNRSTPPAACECGCRFPRNNFV